MSLVASFVGSPSMVHHIISLFGAFLETMLHHQVVFVNEHLTLMAIAYNVYKLNFAVCEFINTCYELNQAFKMI